MSFDKCIELSNHHQHQDTKEFLHPQNILACYPFSHTLLPSPAPGKRRFVLYPPWLLSKCHINGIIQHVAF